MKNKFILLFFCFLGLNTYAETNGNINIHGKIFSKEVYGPPTFGENPNIDSKEKIYYLSWDEAVEFFIDGKNINIKELQLIFLPSKKKSEVLDENSTYNFEGKINTAETGHHYTEYIFIVDKFEKENLSY